MAMNYSISILAILSVAELLVILSVTCAILYMQLRWQRKKVLESKESSTKPGPPIEYLESELEWTHEKLQKIEESISESDGDNTQLDRERLKIAIRAQYLKLETDWANIHGREEEFPDALEHTNFPVALSEGLEHLLELFEIYEQDTETQDVEKSNSDKSGFREDAQELLDQQMQTIGNLQKKIQRFAEPSARDDMTADADLLERYTRELGDCFFVLEDQNQSLREKLSMEDDNEKPANEDYGKHANIDESAQESTKDVDKTAKTDSDSTDDQLS